MPLWEQYYLSAIKNFQSLSADHLEECLRYPKDREEAFENLQALSFFFRGMYELVDTTLDSGIAKIKELERMEG